MSARSQLGALACVTLTGLSCAVFSGAPAPSPGEPPAEAPAVSGAPPAAVAAPSETASRQEAERQKQITRIANRLASRRTGLAAYEIEELARTIVTEARRQGLEPGLVMAVMHVESRFDTFALSPVGAMGLMQILPSTGEELAARQGILWRGPRTLFDPIVNVRLGVAYLRQLSDRYGELSTALAAYNWGPGHIDRRIARGTTLPSVYPRLVFEAHAAQRGRRS